MFTKYSDRVIALAAELFHSKYFAMDAAPDVRIRLATEAAIRQADREREARHRMINRVADATLVFGILGTLVFMVITA
jgi:hypothetical protein